MDEQILPTGTDNALEQSGAPPADATVQADATSQAPPPQLYEVKVDGKVMKLPLDELQKGYSRTAHYTQNMQKLSAERQQWQADLQRYQQAVQEVRAFLGDQKRLGEYYKRLTQQTTPDPQSPDAEEPITMARLQAELKQAMQLRDQAWSERVRSEIQELKLEQLSSNYANDFDAHIEGLLQQYPALRRIPRVERLLKAEAADRQPQDASTAKALLAELAQDWASQQTTFQAEDDKRRAGSTQQLRNGIEPPGGTAPPPTGQSSIYKSLQDARGDVMRDLERMFGAQS